MLRLPFFIVLIVLVPCCAEPSTEVAKIPPNKTPPNIVLMVVEDLSPRLSMYGDSTVSTPNLDLLAAEGVVFERVFTTAGVCSPSRAALITGMHQEAIGAQHMRTSSFGSTSVTPFGTFSTPGPPYETVPPPHVKAFPEYLRAAGYTTLNNNKTDYQFGTPFTIWDASGRDVSLADRDPERPFFLMLSNNDTHESRLFRERYATFSEGAEGWARSFAERFPVDFVYTDPAAVTVPPYLPDTEGVRADIARQYDNIRLLDAWVGSVLHDLADADMLDRTVVLFTTDHGDGLPRGKRSLYDSGLHVPLIVRYPDGTQAGQRRTDLVSFVDLAPSLLTLAGAPVPDHLHGQDVLGPDRPEPRTYVFAARDRLDEHADRSRAVRNAQYKYIRNEVPGRPLLAPLAYRENLRSMQALRQGAASGTLTPLQARLLSPERPAKELYDLAADPHETINLIDDPAHTATRDRLRTALAAHRAGIGDYGLLDEEAMVTTMMWPGGVQPTTAAPHVHPDTSAQFHLSSLTGVASIGYRFCPEPGCTADTRWHLYTAQLAAPSDAALLEAKAIRYGFRESAVTRYGLAEQLVD